MDGGIVQIVNWLFLAASLGLGVYNTLTIRENVKRERQKGMPTVEVEVQVEGEGQAVTLNLFYPAGPTVRWLPLSARILTPRGAKIANAGQLLSYNQDNEPWIPKPVAVDWAAQTDRATLSVRDRPGNETIYVWLPHGRSATVEIDIHFESAEARKRTHIVKLNRKIETLTPSITY